MTKIIKFGATWCKNCYYLDIYLNELNIDNVEYIDYDNEEYNNIIETYMITKLPTLVIMTNDDNIEKFEGFSDIRKTDLYNLLNKHNLINQKIISNCDDF
jgi:thiol-disulfide isomerase/thioredoxin